MIFQRIDRFIMARKNALIWLAVAAALAFVGARLAYESFTITHHAHMRSFTTHTQHPQYRPILTHIATKGATPEVKELLARASGGEGVEALYVGDPKGNIYYVYPEQMTETIVAMRTEPRADQRALALFHVGSVKAPDGHVYQLYHAIDRDALGQYGIYVDAAVLVAYISLLLGWAALAAWVFLDAREKSVRKGAAWGMLALVTGPVGALVYLVLRTPNEVCPGCGTVQEGGHAFCHECGHALKPACPDCRRPVDRNWNYCRSCGGSLAG